MRHLVNRLRENAERSAGKFRPSARRDTASTYFSGAFDRTTSSIHPVPFQLLRRLRVTFVLSFRISCHLQEIYAMN